MKSSQSFLCFLVIICVAASVSCKVNRLHMGAFNASGVNLENSTDTRNYLVTNEGDTVYGEKIKWKGGALTKNSISIDDQKFKIAEVRGFQEKNIYYGRLKNSYIKRIVHGKINVYIQYTEMVATTPTSRTYTRTDHYVQHGETGSMVVIGDKKDIMKELEGCPEAVSMLDMSDRKLVRAIKQNRNYLNEAFEIYNNNCKSLSKVAMNK